MFGGYGRIKRMTNQLFIDDATRIQGLIDIIPEEVFLSSLEALENYNQLNIHFVDILIEFFAFRDSISGKFDDHETEKVISLFEVKLHELSKKIENISFPPNRATKCQFLNIEPSDDVKKEIKELTSFLRREYRAILHHFLQKPTNETSVLAYNHGIITYKKKKISLESSSRMAIMDFLWKRRATDKTVAEAISFGDIITITGWNETSVRENIKSFNNDLETKGLPLQFQFHKTNLVLIQKQTH